MWRASPGVLVVVAVGLLVSRADVGNETCEATLLQTSKKRASSNDALTGCENVHPCGNAGGSKDMCITNPGDGKTFAQKVWHISSGHSWETNCDACGISLEGENKICQGWWCNTKTDGVYLKREGAACPQWEGSCNNWKGDQCAAWLADEVVECDHFVQTKECDKQCGLCACSSGSTGQHCNGHGTCRANCDGKYCYDARCECQQGWEGSLCETMVTTTTTTTQVFCNANAASSCSECSEDDCLDDCMWRDGACHERVDCGGKLATSCGECGSYHHCHGECYWDGSCKHPLKNGKPVSCGNWHRADSCSQCIDIFEKMDPAWKNHHRVGCQGDCFYNAFFDSCQQSPPERPTHDLHPQCPENLTAKCEQSAPPETPVASQDDVLKIVDGTILIVAGLTTTTSNFYNAFGERLGNNKNHVKDGVFAWKTLLQIGAVGRFVYNKLTPSPAAPCDSTYSDDEYFLCIWDGIMPYVQDYVDEQLDNLQNQNYQAMLLGVIKRMNELGAQIQDRLEVHEFQKMEVTDDLKTNPAIFELQNATLSELESLHRHMRLNAGEFLKDNAPFSQVVFLNFWALIHTHVLVAMLWLDPQTYQSKDYLHMFGKIIAEYASEIERRGYYAHRERAEQTQLSVGQCPNAKCDFNPDGNCTGCWGTATLEDAWWRCKWESEPMKVGYCDWNNQNTCYLGYTHFYGDCGTGVPYETCVEQARMCHKGYSGNILMEADKVWFDFAVVSVPALRSASQKLTGAWPGPAHIYKGSVCAGTGRLNYDLADNSQKKHALCCDKICSDKMCTCSPGTMTWEEADGYCKSNDKQLCSRYEYALDKCCNLDSPCSGHVWTRSLNTTPELFASEEPCMMGEDFDSETKLTRGTTVKGLPGRRNNSEE